jgi:hypothetical protein
MQSLGIGKKRAHRTGTLGEAENFDLYSILKPYVNFDLALASQSRKAVALVNFWCMHCSHCTPTSTAGFVQKRWIFPKCQFLQDHGILLDFKYSCNFPTNPDLRFHELLRSVGVSSNRAANSLTSICISESPEAPKVWWKVGWVSLLGYTCISRDLSDWLIDR